MKKRVPFFSDMENRENRKQGNRGVIGIRQIWFVLSIYGWDSSWNVENFPVVNTLSSCVLLALRISVSYEMNS